ncbi:MAG: type VI secretion system protein TssA [Acidobacteria bacterium]|nr:type VI secretion system protein TssA [Acidobacteriota bacterium]
MPFREDILNPVPGDSPGGADLRYDPVYDKIKEARREEEDIEQGDWKRERKVADWPLTSKLCEEVLATRSKDLQLAAWLTEAAVRQRGIEGILEGMALVHGLLDTFWDHLYPELEDGDAEFRATPLDWLSNQLIRLLQSLKLTKDGYSYLKFKESRDVGYEDGNASEKAIETRKTKLDEGKLAPELFDESFDQTPKTFYVSLFASLNQILTDTKSLAEVCDEKFGDYSPSFSRFVQSTEEVRQVAKNLLDKKREMEPDPIEEVAEETTSDGDPATGETISVAPQGSGINIAAFTGAEPGSRKSIIEGLVHAAAQLRQMDPTNPGSYLMMRGLRFGELRAAAAKGELRSLEAPPTEIRRQLRVYSLDSKWKELLDLTEASLALPASRAWLDLHRMTAEACVGLGDEYNGVNQAIRGEVRTLLRDVPEIRNAILMDDTPACNPQTLAWLDELNDDPPALVESEESDPSTAILRPGKRKGYRPALFGRRQSKAG